MQRRAFLTIPLFGLLSACAGPAPKRAVLGTDQLAGFKITAVSVDVSSLGTMTGTGRSVYSGDVKSALLTAAKPKLVGLGNGSTPATAVINISSINIITAGQSIMIGGESVLRGTVSVKDRGSGKVLMAPVKTSAGGGGWVLGGVVGVISMDDPDTEIKQLSAEFAKRAATLIAGV